MNKKTITVIFLSVVFTLFVFMAIFSGLNNNGDAYHGAVISTKNMVGKVKNSTSMPEVAVTKVKNNTAVADVATKVDKGDSEVKEAVVTEASDSTKENENESALYSVVDGNKLDAKSYAGFKLFRNWCSRCHGTYGQGLVGPNLAERLKIISEKQFFDTVKNGKTGQIGSMPTWKKNVKVMEGRDKLYAYLMARSDGAIGAVKPQKQ